jgi:hypothetical protein
MHSTVHNTPCKDLEEQVSWRKEVCRIWLPSRDAVLVSLEDPKVKGIALQIPQVLKSTPEGKIYLPTARHIWDTLSRKEPTINGMLSAESSIRAFEQLETVTENSGREIFYALLQDHLTAIEKERKRGEYFFRSRKKAIELVGLAKVRQYRLKHLEQEKTEWESNLEKAASVIPEIRPLLLLSIQKK